MPFARGRGTATDKWYQMHVQKLHKQRLRNMKSAVDNRAPKLHSHMRNNTKKQQELRERYQRIEKENRILLAKMSKIMQGDQTLDNRLSRFNVAHSLNKTARRKGLEKITNENHQMLRYVFVFFLFTNIDVS